VLEIIFKDNGVVALSGRFDAAQSRMATDALESITESCTIDMTDLDYISSAGLGILLETYKRLDDSGQVLILKNINRHIRRIFEVSGLDKLFPAE
jgi:anti-anti-sigma factor